MLLYLKAVAAICKKNGRTPISQKDLLITTSNLYSTVTFNKKLIKNFLKCFEKLIEAAKEGLSKI